METSVFVCVQGSRSKEKPEVFNYWIQSVFCSRASHSILYISRVCIMTAERRKFFALKLFMTMMQNSYFESGLNKEQMCFVSSLHIVNFVILLNEIEVIKKLFCGHFLIFHAHKDSKTCFSTHTHKVLPDQSSDYLWALCVCWNIQCGLCVKCVWFLLSLILRICEHKQTAISCLLIWSQLNRSPLASDILNDMRWWLTAVTSPEYMQAKTRRVQQNEEWL